jgi:hypothetical protein
MKPIAHLRISGVVLGGALILSSVAGAQQKSPSSISQSRAYDLHREVSLTGAVVEYKAASATLPLGAHVTLQTSSGIVDVHLGNPQLLAANHFSLVTGDTLRIFGENLNGAQGPQFVARIIQKGSQSLTLRSLQGIPLKPGRANSAQSQKQDRGVL